MHRADEQVDHKTIESTTSFKTGTPTQVSKDLMQQSVHSDFNMKVL